MPSSQTCCCCFLRTTPPSWRPQTYIHEPIHSCHTECARLISRQKKKLEITRETEARERLDQAMICVSSQRYCSLTCCLLLIIILFLYLSLQKHARLLLLHGNHLLVSLSCSAASVIHNILPSASRMDAAA